MESNAVFRKWRIQSFTKPNGPSYFVTEFSDGGFECTCPAWLYREDKRPCKHCVFMMRILRGGKDGSQRTLAEIDKTMARYPDLVHPSESKYGRKVRVGEYDISLRLPEEFASDKREEVVARIGRLPVSNIAL